MRKQVGKSGEQVRGRTWFLPFGTWGIGGAGDPLEGQAQGMVTKRTLELGQRGSTEDRLGGVIPRERRRIL